MFPIDFVVMDIEEYDDVPLILGRPFMKTSRVMIDIDDGFMKVRVQDEDASFKLFNAMKHSKDKGVYFKWILLMKLSWMCKNKCVYLLL